LSMNGQCNDTELMKHVVHTHRTSRRSSWSHGFGALNSSPHSWIFTSVSVDFIPRSYLFTSAMVGIAVNFAPNCGTEPIRYVTLHLGDRHVAASLRYRNRTKITVLMCKQNSYPVWLSCRRKSYPGLVWTASESHCIVHSLTITNESRRLSETNGNFSNQNQEL